MAADDISSKIPPPIRPNSNVNGGDDIPSHKPRARAVVESMLNVTTKLTILGFGLTFVILFLDGFNVWEFHLDTPVLVTLVASTMGLSITSIIRKVVAMVVS